MPIWRHGPQAPHCELAGRVKVWAETIHPNGSPRYGHPQEPDGWEQFQHVPVVIARLSWETVEQIPVRHNVIFLAPLQQLDVLQRGGSLTHQLQHMIAHALDAGLDAVYSSVAQ